MASSYVSLALVVALSVQALIACSGPDARVYTARKYDAAAACIEGSIPVGVVHVESLPSTCDPVCMLVDDALYVSTVCAPYPARANLVGPEETADCGLAIALLEADARCTDDVLAPTDAGTGDASTTAAVDAAPSDGGDAASDEAGSDAGASEGDASIGDAAGP
jgi:hypothetical protein